MEIISSEIPDAKIIKTSRISDERGYFAETFRLNEIEKRIGPRKFVQENESLGSKNTFRGFHYQLPPFAQSKLVRVTLGAVMDYVVDLRSGSETFGQSLSIELSAENGLQLFVPRGFAHGFRVLSDSALFQYKVDNYYSREHERSFHCGYVLSHAERRELILSEKDLKAPPFSEATYFNKSDLYES